MYLVKIEGSFVIVQCRTMLGFSTIGICFGIHLATSALFLACSAISESSS